MINYNKEKFSMNYYTILAMITLASLGGCAEQENSMGVGPKANVLFKSTTHKKWKWVAEDYFDDVQVIALCKAIEVNDLEEMERLIKKGANVNAVGWAGMTPLLWAFPDNKIERFKLLLKNGANPDVVINPPFDPRGFFNPAHPEEKQRALFNSGGFIRAGWSVSHLAGRSKFSDHFKEVLKHGCDLELAHEKLTSESYTFNSLKHSFINDSGMTEKEAHDKMLEVTQNSSQDSLLHVVIKAGIPDKVERVQMLIDAGADLNHIGGDRTPASTAVGWGGQYHLAVMLLEAGADPTMFGNKSTKRLVHTIVVAKKVRSIRTTKQKANFQKIIGILEAHGESLEEAEKDLERWSGWLMGHSKEYGQWRKEEATKLRAKRKSEAAQKPEIKKPEN